MKDKKIKGVLIDVENDKAEVVEFEPELEEYYRLLDCTLIERTVRKIGNSPKRFTFICDEEGMLKANPVISAVNRDMSDALFGNIMVVKGLGAGLTDEEAEYVLSNVRKVRTALKPNPYPVIYDIRY